MLNQQQFFDKDRYASGDPWKGTTPEEHGFSALNGNFGDAPVVTEGGTKVARGDVHNAIIETKQRKYYHGSTNAIPVGSYVTPGIEHSKDNYGMRRNQSVFMTNDRGNARYWASATGPDTTPRYVHEVEPEGLNERHPRIVGEFQANRAKVVKRWRSDPPNPNGGWGEWGELVREHDPKPSGVLQPQLFK
jgi:hypothetical protein